MKMTKKPGKNRIVLMVLAALCILALAGVSLGAYTRQASMRGVLRNRDNEDIGFTSNYMQLCMRGATENSYVIRTVSYGEDDKNEATVSFELSVYNYATGNKDVVSQRDIKYTMSIQFKDGSSQGYEVIYDDQAITANEDGVYTMTNTLVGRVADENIYTIKIPGKDLDKVKIIATAIPENGTVTNNQMLAAIITPVTGEKTQTFRAEGKYVDESFQTDPTQYDAFNYEISISSGEADATLTWDSSVVEIDRYFLEKIEMKKDDIDKILKSEEKTQTINFVMNQSNGTGDYLIPFYKKTSTVPGSWDEMKKIITFGASQKQ